MSDGNPEDLDAEVHLGYVEALVDNGIDKLLLTVYYGHERNDDHFREALFEMYRSGFWGGFGKAHADRNAEVRAEVRAAIDRAINMLQAWTPSVGKSNTELPAQDAS